MNHITERAQALYEVVKHHGGTTDLVMNMGLAERLLTAHVAGVENTTDLEWCQVVELFKADEQRTPDGETL